MQQQLIFVVRRAAMLMLAALFAVLPSSQAMAQVRTSLSFFSATDLRQGQIGGLGTVFDANLGQPVAAQSRACCFAVTAAAQGGTPFELRRTFVGFDTISQIYYMGVSTVAGQDHLVLALNQAFSTTLIGREFSNAFTGFSETQIINDLFAQFDQTLTVQQRIAAGDRLGTFQNQLFSLNAGFGVSDRFSLTSFSIGVPAGTGFSSLLGVTGAVPEPSTWMMAILGFALVGSAMRRQRPGAARQRWRTALPMA